MRPYCQGKQGFETHTPTTYKFTDVRWEHGLREKDFKVVPLLTSTSRHSNI